ncbi:MAG: antitoxin [bacterium]
MAGSAAVKARLQRLAVGHLRKDAKINVRLSQQDLDGLRRRASEEGLPYQTLISSLLHKFVAGRLVEKAARG